MSRRLSLYLAALCVLSLLLTVFTFALIDGGRKVSWRVPDSRGRIFDFNEPMSEEHVAIAMSKVTLQGMMKEAGPYGCLLVAMQIVGTILMPCARSAKKDWIRAFFLLQLILFPFGFAAMLVTPWVFMTFDGEALTDGPAFWYWSQGFWLIVAGAVILCAIVDRRTKSAEDRASA